jgi:hypothetical protein
MHPVLVGGLFIGVLSALPVVQLCNCCCVWLIGGGALTAYLQQQDRPAGLNPMEGAGLGLVAGVIGAVAWFVTAAALSFVLAPLQERLLSELLQNAGDMPPEVRTWLEQAEAAGPGGNFFGFLIMLVVSPLFAALGGALGASYFRKDVPPALGGPVTPPPLS